MFDAETCKKVFSRTRVPAPTIAHEEVGNGQEELLLLRLSCNFDTRRLAYSL